MGTRTTISLNVELHPGTDIDTCSNDLIELANKLGVHVTAQFNDVLLMAFPGGSPTKLANNYRKQVAQAPSHKIAVSK